MRGADAPPGVEGGAASHPPAPHGRQATIRQPIDCIGTGLHGGRRVRLTLRPAAEGSGITFRRTDLGIDVPARFARVSDTRLCTVLAPAGRVDARVATVEHVMAALAGCGIDNALVELDGPEVPALDGSAGGFVFLLDCAGRVEQAAPRVAIEVLKAVRVTEGEAFAELRPFPTPGLCLSLSIDFPAAAIGRQTYALRLDGRSFRRELADCRTFALLGEIEAMRAAGLARGGTLDNAVVVDGAAVLNPAGLRRPDEFVRHKMLDAVGDLALAGHPLQARFVGHRSGHGLNNRLLRALMADRSAWRLSGSRPVPERAAA